MNSTKRCTLVVVCLTVLLKPCIAEEKPAYQDPQVAEKLKNGDTPTRQAIIRELFVEPKKLLTLDDAFLDAFMAGADDADAGVRQTSIALIGERWIWKGGELEPRAVEFLLKRTYDEDDQTTYGCVYYGLSAMRPMSEPVIDRLIELAVAKGKREPKSVFSRVLWGFRANPKRAASRIQAYLDRHDGKDARTGMRTMHLYFELTQRVPTGLEKFADTGTYKILMTPQPPFLPRTEAELKTRLLSLVKEFPTASEPKTAARSGQLVGLVTISGMPAYGKLLNAIEASHSFKIPAHGLASPELAALEQGLFGRPNPPEQVSYTKAFGELYRTLGQRYPCFELKGIDWEAVGTELLPISKDLRTRDEFALLCHRLLARLEDSHAQLLRGSASPAVPPSPRWDPGFACLIDELGNPVVYFIDDDSPAEMEGMQLGMTIVAINGEPAKQAVERCMNESRQYTGFSSERLLRYQAARWFIRQVHKQALVRIEAHDTQGKVHKFEMPATLDVRYLPRLPVPIDGIRDSANVSWKRLDDGIGYVYVRRIRSSLISDLDRAVAALEDCRGLILDVRGNSGGGFDAARSFRNFDVNDTQEPERPRFTGPMAVLIDARCISAGEGWTSWFAANRRARFFGEATAGASSRKVTVDVADGLFRAIFPVKAYQGFLDRPIERVGLEPDVDVHQTAENLSRGVDTVLEAARKSLSQ